MRADARAVAVAFVAACLASCELLVDLDPVPGVATGDPSDCGVTHAKCASGSCVNGDCARRVFVTSAAMTGAFGGPAIANAACNSAAAPFFGDASTFRAWLSVADASAGSLLGSSNAPFLLPDGKQVAPSSAALLGTIPLEPQTYLVNAINEAEDGGVVSDAGVNVWTGTMPDGSVDSTSRCGEWSSTDASTTAGYSTAADMRWTAQAVLRPCSNLAHFYCIEQIQ